MTITNGLLEIDKGKNIRAHATQAFRTRRDITPLILEIITRWSWATDFTSCSIYHRKQLRYQLNLVIVVFRDGLHVLEKRGSFTSVQNRKPYCTVCTLVILTYMLCRIGLWLVTNYKYDGGANFRSLSFFIHTVVSINSNRLCDRQLQLQVCITVELHSSGLIGTASHLVMQKTRVIGLVFENRLHWQFAVRLLLFTVCTALASKSFNYGWFVVLHAITLYCTWSDNR